MEHVPLQPEGAVAFFGDAMPRFDDAGIESEPHIRVDIPCETLLATHED